ncbi:MAG: hypothetical protein LBT18_05380, partial [Endomicrobium sp.]|nr:hypothetical protein [Endomicrobium sp.]
MNIKEILFKKIFQFLQERRNKMTFLKRIVPVLAILGFLVMFAGETVWAISKEEGARQIEELGRLSAEEKGKFISEINNVWRFSPIGVFTRSKIVEQARTRDAYYALDLLKFDVNVQQVLRNAMSREELTRLVLSATTEAKLKALSNDITTGLDARLNASDQATTEKLDASTKATTGVKGAVDKATAA